MSTMDPISNGIEMQGMLSQKSDLKKNYSPFNSEKSCRICFAGKSKGRLISTCNCKGTLGSVHQDCMERWLQVKASDKCELCNTKLNVKKVNQDLKDWLKQKDNMNRRYFVIDCICAVILTPISCFSLYLCLSGAIYYSASNWDTSALIALVILLISSYILWFCVCLEHHWTAFHTFKFNNFKVILLDKKKSDLEAKQSQPKEVFSGHNGEEAKLSLLSRLRAHLQVPHPLVRNGSANTP